MYSLNDLRNALNEGIVVFKEVVGDKHQYLYATRNTNLINALVSDYNIRREAVEAINECYASETTKKWAMFDILANELKSLEPHFFTGVSVEVCKATKPEYESLNRSETHNEVDLEDIAIDIADHLTQAGLMKTYNDAGEELTFESGAEFELPEAFLRIEKEKAEIISIGFAKRNQDRLSVTYQGENGIAVVTLDDGVICENAVECDYKIKKKSSELRIKAGKGVKICFDLSDIQGDTTEKEPEPVNDDVREVVYGVIEMSRTLGTVFIPEGSESKFHDSFKLPATMVVLEAGRPEIYLNKF